MRRRIEAELVRHRATAGEVDPSAPRARARRQPPGFVSTFLREGPAVTADLGRAVWAEPSWRSSRLATALRDRPAQPARRRPAARRAAVREGAPGPPVPPDPPLGDRDRQAVLRVRQHLADPHQGDLPQARRQHTLRGGSPRRSARPRWCAGRAQLKPSCSRRRRRARCDRAPPTAASADDRLVGLDLPDVGSMPPRGGNRRMLISSCSSCRAQMGCSALRSAVMAWWLSA